MANVLIRNGNNTTKTALFKKVRENLTVKEQITLATDLGLTYVIPEGFDATGNEIRQPTNYRVTATAEAIISATSREEAIEIAKTVTVTPTYSAIETDDVEESNSEEDTDNDEDSEDDE